jgi:hypothetical protein
VERVRARMASTRSIATAAVVNCRPGVTCPVSGVRAVETKGSAIAFLVSRTLSSSSMAARRPTPSTRMVVPPTSFQRLCISSWLACLRRSP